MYGDRIIELHEKDIELYEFAKTSLLEREKLEYGQSFEKDLATQIHKNETWTPPRLSPYIDFAIRRFYYQPLTGLIRVMNGMPAKGLR